MDEQFNKQPKNHKNLQTLIQETKLGEIPNYYVYASKIFTQKEVDEIKLSDIVYERQNNLDQKRQINPDDTTSGKANTGKQKQKKIQKETVKQIRIIILPKIALPERAGGSRSRTRQKRYQQRKTKKRQHLRKGRRTLKRKQNKRRTKKR